MSEVGYCTLEDLRRALREAGLPGDVEQDPQIAVDAITAETEPLQRRLKRHFYEPTGIDESTDVTVPTEPKTRNDEESISTGGVSLSGESTTPKTWQGPYTRIQLGRNYAKQINKLLVQVEGGSYTDWVASDEYSGGQWPTAIGEDYFLRVNNGGVSHLYIDSHNFLDKDGEPIVDSFANVVYVDFDYGHEGIPQAVRRAIALRAGAELVEEAVIEIPQNATVYDIDTKAERMREKAEELLKEYGGKYEEG